MRKLLFIILVLPLFSTAQTYWGTKARWGVVPLVSHLPVSLFRYEYGAPAVVVIDTVRRSGIEVDVDALAHHPVLGLLAWGLIAGGSQMVLLDSTTAAAQDFGPFLAGRQIRGACFDRTQDIFALDHLNNDLLFISSTDGSVLDAVPLLLDGAPFDLGASCDIDQVSGSWYIHDAYTLYRLDVVSGEVTAIFTDTVPDLGDDLPGCTVPPPACGGMAELPDSGSGAYLAFDGNCEDDFFRYNVLSADSRFEVLHDVLPAYNGGAIDLALQVEASGPTSVATTAPCNILTAVYLPGQGLHIRAGCGALNGNMRLYDTAGKLLFAERGNGSLSHMLPITLPSGLYVLHITGEGERSVRVLVP